MKNLQAIGAITLAAGSIRALALRSSSDALERGFLNSPDRAKPRVWSVNGKPLGIAWKPPFRIDVTSALKTGANRLEVKVTNLWVNRLIGNQQPGTHTKYTYTTQLSPLLPSGLLGPVRIVRIEGE